MKAIILSKFQTKSKISFLTNLTHFAMEFRQSDYSFGICVPFYVKCTIIAHIMRSDSLLRNEIGTRILSLFFHFFQKVAFHFKISHVD